MTLLSGSLKYRIALAVAFLALVAMLGSQPAPREQVGPLPGGAFLLNSGWRVDPVGRQVPLDTLPMSSALTPDGKYLLVLNGGWKPPSVSVIETASGNVKGSVPVADGWLGLAISPAGDRVYVGGGQKASIFEFALADGVLTPARTFVVVPQEQRGSQDFIGDVAFTPDGRLLYCANLYRDMVQAITSPPTSPSTCCRRWKKSFAAAFATRRSATACNASAPSPPGTTGSALPIQFHRTQTVRRRRTTRLSPAAFPLFVTPPPPPA